MILRAFDRGSSLFSVEKKTTQDKDTQLKAVEVTRLVESTGKQYPCKELNAWA